MMQYPKLDFDSEIPRFFRSKPVARATRDSREELSVEFQALSRTGRHLYKVGCCLIRTRALVWLYL